MLLRTVPLPRTGSQTWLQGDYLQIRSLQPDSDLLIVERIISTWYLVGQDDDFPKPGIGMRNLTQPHEQVDARDPASRPVLLEGAIAGHVLVKNDKGALPFPRPPTIISVYGYDATVPPTKNTDRLFELGYTSSQEMGQAQLGTPQTFDQAARGGTIVTGGRAGANAPAYMLDVCLVPLPSSLHQLTDFPSH